MPKPNERSRPAPAVTLAACAIFAVASALLGQTALPPSRPVEAIGGIAEMVASHRVVAIGNVEFRGDEQTQAFFRSLVRDQRFIATGAEIVVEFGNARYQSVIDRFIAGGDVPEDSLHDV